MKRTGFKIDDLVCRNAEDVNARYGDHITEKALIDKRYDHYEEKRVAKLDILKKVRSEVLDEESKGAWNSQSVTLLSILRGLRLWLSTSLEWIVGRTSNLPSSKRNSSSFRRSSLSKYTSSYSAKINRTNHSVLDEDGRNQEK